MAHLSCCHCSSESSQLLFVDKSISSTQTTGGQYASSQSNYKVFANQERNTVFPKVPSLCDSCFRNYFSSNHSQLLHSSLTTAGCHMVTHQSLCLCGWGLSHIQTSQQIYASAEHERAVKSFCSDGLKSHMDLYTLHHNLMCVVPEKTTSG